MYVNVSVWSIKINLKMKGPKKGFDFLLHHQV